MKKILLRILSRACVCYTVTVFLVLLLYLALNRDLSGGVKPAALLLIFPFSLLFVSANYQLRAAKFAYALRVLLHAVLTLGGVWCCLVLPMRDPTAGASQALALFVVLAAIYVILMSVVLGISARVRHVKRDESDYQGVYKK